MTARKRLRDYEGDGAGPSTAKKVVFVLPSSFSAKLLYCINAFTLYNHEWAPPPFISHSSKVCYDPSVALALMDPAPISCDLPPPEKRGQQITMEEAKRGTAGTEHHVSS